MRWVIVAHPDDEVIFAGGAILSHREEPWTVVIATQTEGSARAAESLAARDQLRALGVDIDYRFLGHREAPFGPRGGIDRRRLAGQLAALGVRPGERVYTHGAPGEYGHNGHKAVHAEVLKALGQTARLTVFSGGGEIVERIVDAEVLAGKARVFNAAYPSQQAVWTGLAPAMIETTTEERHLAPSVLDAALAQTTNPLHPYAPGPPGPPDLGALVAQVSAEIVRVRAAREAALVIGDGEGVDLDLLRSRYAGRLDVAAGDPADWAPEDRLYDLVLCVGVLSRTPNPEAIIRRIGELLRPGGQSILAHEPLIQGHPDYGRAALLADQPHYRRPTQAVIDLARKSGMKLKSIRDLVAGSRLGEPVIVQLLRFERR